MKDAKSSIGKKGYAHIELDYKDKALADELKRFAEANGMTVDFSTRTKFGERETESGRKERKRVAKFHPVDAPTVREYMSEAPSTMEDDFVKEGYKKNSEGRWEKDPTSGMTNNITHDVYGDWGKNIKAAPTGTSFSVRSSNRWHDEVEKFTKTDTGWRFERTVDGRGADKGNADLGRIWNSLRDGRLLG